MRTAMAVVLTGLILAAINGPTASAEPFAPPEVSPGGVVFTDNPAIVDPHPISVESWSRAADANAPTARRAAPVTGGGFSSNAGAP